jgi:hypothetical protein
VSIFLTTNANEKNKSKLEHDLKKDTWVVSRDYEIVSWHPEKRLLLKIRR